MQPLLRHLLVKPFLLLLSVLLFLISTSSPTLADNRPSEEARKPSGLVRIDSVRFDATRTTATGPTGRTLVQEVPRESAGASAGEPAPLPGAVVIECSLPTRGSTLAFGLEVERFVDGQGWRTVPEPDLGVGVEPGDPGRNGARVLLLARGGWDRGADYRARFSYALAGEPWESTARQETLKWHIPAPVTPAKTAPDPPPVPYEKRKPTEFDSTAAAADTLGGRFPGGQNHLFHGMWHDPVTGLAYARDRWYDPRTGTWLSEDPSGDVDSPDRYAYVGRQPHLARDPLGRQMALEFLAERREAEEAALLLTLTPEERAEYWAAVRARETRDAVEAASLAVGFVPYLGELHDTSQVVLGRDVITGEELSDTERGVVAGAATLPLVGGTLARRLAKIPGVDRFLAKLGRSAEVGEELVGEAAQAGARPGVEVATEGAEAAVPRGFPHGFSSVAEFESFTASLKAGLRQAGFDDAQAIFQGSSVTGRKFTTGAAFDVGRVSDFDIALASPNLLARARAVGVPLRSAGTRTAPLTAQQLEALGLRGLADELALQAGRPVNFMVFESAEAATSRAPSVPVP